MSVTGSTKMHDVCRPAGLVHCARYAAVSFLHRHPVCAANDTLISVNINEIWCCEECLHVRSRSDLLMKLDECITGLAVTERNVNDRAAEVGGLKISNLGGLTKARRMLPPSVSQLRSTRPDR